jgi:hypothetical protein
MIGGPNWLLSCWHEPQTFVGAQRARSDNNGPDRLTREHVAAVVSRRWVDTKSTSIADLGVLILHELAESYRPTVYELYSWLDDWELSLYAEESVDRVTLQALWGSAATLRAWVKPLNLPGMRADPDKAWFHGGSNHENVLAVDDRVDGALSTLRKLSDTLRASFAVAQFQLAEEERRERERFQARVALLTATLAGPILVTALFGARATPFGDNWASFAAITVITIASIAAIWGLLTLRTGEAREPAKSSLPAAWMAAPAYHLLPREGRRGGGAFDAAHWPRPIARVPSAC